jgi:hypothetical protein
MKKIIIISLLITTNIFAAIITGNQEKASIIGGSMDVTSGGSTVTVNSGELTSYKDGQAPTIARPVTRGDLNDVYNELTPTGDEDIVNIKLAPIDPAIAGKVRLELVQKGISRDKIVITQMTSGAQIFISKINLDDIKQIYGGHYKAGLQYFANNANKGKQPTINIKAEDIKKYHSVIFRKAGK